MNDEAAIDKIRKAFALALHPNTGSAEQKAAWIGALRLCVAHGFTTFDEIVEAATPEPEEEPDEAPPDGWYMEMPFGKHKGMSLGGIALRYPDYLDWLMGQKITSRRLRESVAEVYRWRKHNGAH